MLRHIEPVSVVDVTIKFRKIRVKAPRALYRVGSDHQETIISTAEIRAQIKVGLFMDRVTMLKVSK